MSAPPKINPILPELIKAQQKYRLLRRNGNTRKNTVGTALKNGNTLFRIKNKNIFLSNKEYAFYPVNALRSRLAMSGQRVENYYSPGSGRNNTFKSIQNYKGKTRKRRQ